MVVDSINTRGKFFDFNQIQILEFFFGQCYSQGYPWVPSKNVSPFGPAVWPAFANINIYMFDIAGQTAGPNGLTFFVDTHG